MNNDNELLNLCGGMELFLVHSGNDACRDCPSTYLFVISLKDRYKVENRLAGQPNPKMNLSAGKVF